MNFVRTRRINKIFSASFLFWAALLISFEPGSVSGQDKEKNFPDSRAEKILISADTLVANQNSQFVAFSGNVKAVQGSTTIFSDNLKVYYNDPKDAKEIYTKDSIKKIIASGNVRIEFEDKTAQCEQAVYILDNQSLTLTGDDTRIESAGNFISGEKITFYQNTGQIIVDGSENKRVNAEFQPDKKTSISDLK